MLGERIRTLVNEGLTPSEIVEVLGCAKSTVSYHVKKMGLTFQRSHDWTKIQAHFDRTGCSVMDCMAHFGFTRSALKHAKARGWVKVKRRHRAINRMRNGPYILVGAPEDYPGPKYRGRYCYEHHLVWWENGGQLPRVGELIHHVNHDKTDNQYENLELMTVSAHTRQHNFERYEKSKRSVLQAEVV